MTVASPSVSFLFYEVLSLEKFELFETEADAAFATHISASPESQHLKPHPGHAAEEFLCSPLIRLIHVFF